MFADVCGMNICILVHDYKSYWTGTKYRMAVRTKSKYELGPSSRHTRSPLWWGRKFIILAFIFKRGVSKAGIGIALVSDRLVALILEKNCKKTVIFMILWESYFMEWELGVSLGKHYSSLHSPQLLLGLERRMLIQGRYFIFLKKCRRGGFITLLGVF